MKEEIEAARLVVEVVAEGCNEEQAQRSLVLQQHVDEGESQEEEEEQSRGEEHRLVGMVGELLYDTFKHGVLGLLFYCPLLL